MIKLLKLFPNVETNYRKVLTQKGKMKLSNEEVDDLIKKVSPESLQSGVINYRDIIEQFVSDYDQVNIINSKYSKDIAPQLVTLSSPRAGYKMSHFCSFQLDLHV